MRKLKLLIVLALLPAVLTACGKSDAEKAKSKGTIVNTKLNRAGQLDAELIIGMDALAERIKIGGLEKVNPEEVTALKAKAQEALTLYSEAIAIDDSSKEIRISNRGELNRRLESLQKSFKVLEDLEAKLKELKPKEKLV